MRAAVFDGAHFTGLAGMDDRSQAAPSPPAPPSRWYGGLIAGLATFLVGLVLLPAPQPASAPPAAIPAPAPSAVAGAPEPHAAPPTAAVWGEPSWLGVALVLLAAVGAGLGMGALCRPQADSSISGGTAAAAELGLPVLATLHLPHVRPAARGHVSGSRLARGLVIACEAVVAAGVAAVFLQVLLESPAMAELAGDPLSFVASVSERLTQQFNGAPARS